MSNPILGDISRAGKVVAGSDRSFGLVMTTAFGAFTIFSGWTDGTLWPWTAGVACLMLVVTLARPRVLKPLKLLWLRFGLLLHRVVSPVVMALMFFGAIWPTGLLLRARRRDLLRLKLEPQAPTYWIARQPPGPSPESMKDQF